MTAPILEQPLTVDELIEQLQRLSDTNQGGEPVIVGSTWRVTGAESAWAGHNTPAVRLLVTPDENAVYLPDWLD